MDGCAAENTGVLGTEIVAGITVSNRPSRTVPPVGQVQHQELNQWVARVRGRRGGLDLGKAAYSLPTLSLVVCCRLRNPHTVR